MYCVYLLINSHASRTYVGFTVSDRFEKRLEKHNAGTGANATAGETWICLVVVTGFPRKNTATLFEAIMHRPWKTAYGGYCSIKTSGQAHLLSNRLLLLKLLISAFGIVQQRVNFPTKTVSSALAQYLIGVLILDDVSDTESD